MSILYISKRLPKIENLIYSKTNIYRKMTYKREEKDTQQSREKPLSERLCTAYSFIFIQMSSGENAASGC